MRDPQLERYAALTRRVHALLREQEADGLAAPPEVGRLLALAVHRLGLHVSAMPGAQPPGPPEFEALRRGGDAPGSAKR